MRGTSLLFLFVCSIFAVVGCQQGTENGSISSGLDSHQSKTASASNQNSSTVVDSLQHDAAQHLERVASESLPESADDLMSLLARLDIEQLRETDPSKSILLQKQRELASKRLLDLKPTIETQREAIRIHLNALAAQDRFLDPSAARKFDAFAAHWQSHADSKIAQTVDLERVTFEYANLNDPSKSDMSHVIQSVNEIANRYPNAAHVFNRLVRISQDILHRGDSDAWRQMAQSLVAVYGSSAQPRLRNQAAALQKQMDLSTWNLREIAQRITEDDQMPLGEMRVAIADILRTDLTADNLQHICRTLLWLERNATVQKTRQINSMVAELNQSTNPDHLQTILQRNCDLRKARLDLLGNEFQIDAKSARGGNLNWHSVSGNRRTMVVFWSPKDVGSIEFVKNLAKIYESHQENRVQLVAVNVTHNANTTKIFGDNLPQWEIVMAVRSRTAITKNVSTSSLMQPDPKMIEKYGIESLPHFITVDENGVVTHINPKQPELERFLRNDN